MLDRHSVNKKGAARKQRLYYIDRLRFAGLYRENI